jgi:FkbM family methyltransferase
VTSLERRVRLVQRAMKVPPLNSERVRSKAITAYRAAKFRRARIAERFGSSKYSTPAQAGMDVALAKILSPGGTFIEAGANDGYRQSNTYYLERFHGWSGVLVEPVPHLAEVARKRRKAAVFNCGLVANDFEGETLTIRYGDLMSGVDVGLENASWGWERAYDIEIPARTLDSVLEEAGIGKVDLLSLDVEGYEVPVLQGFDLERFSPGHVLIEIRDGDPAPVQAQLPGYELQQWLTDEDALFARA